MKLNTKIKDIKRQLMCVRLIADEFSNLINKSEINKIILELEKLDDNLEVYDISVRLYITIVKVSKIINTLTSLDGDLKIIEKIYKGKNPPSIDELIKVIEYLKLLVRKDAKQ